MSTTPDGQGHPDNSLMGRMIDPRLAISRHNRWADAGITTLNAGLVATGLVLATGPVLGPALLLAGMVTALGLPRALSIPLSCHEEQPSARTAAMTYDFSRLAGIRQLVAVETGFSGTLAKTSGNKLWLQESFAGTRNTPALAAVIGHEIGHHLYSRIPGRLNVGILGTALVGLAVAAAAPVSMAGAAILLAATAGSHLLSRWQQRREEFACDRVSVILAGPSATLSALGMRERAAAAGAEPGLLQRHGQKLPVLRRVRALLDDHPPTEIRKEAAQAFARLLPSDHDREVTGVLNKVFGSLARPATLRSVGKTAVPLSAPA